MKLIQRFAGLKTLALLLTATLFSFSSPKGGESFEVYLNNKLLFQQHVANGAKLRSITLDRRFADGKLEVTYNHCGEIGKSRSITFKDANDRTLRTFSFTSAEKRMSCQVKDILDLNKKGNDEIRLYYASKEIPNGKLLASIVVSNGNMTLP